MKKNVLYIAITVLFSLVSSGLFAICASNFQFNEVSPLNVQFQNTSVSYNEGNIHYYWDFGDGHTGFDENPLHLYSAPGIYEVSLTIITTNLCYDCRVISVYIGIPSNSPTCSLEIDFQTFNATAPDYNNGSATVFGFSDVPCCYYAFWSNGAEGESVEGLSPGTYCVTLTNGETCYGTSCVTIGYNNNCVASFSIDSLTFSHLDGAYRFINNSHGEQDSFFWDFGDGTTSNGYNPMHVYADTGIYDVCLTIRTHYDCEHTFCKTLNVDYGSSQVANLYGIVKAGEALLPQGIAILYEYEAGKYKAIDYTIFENGNYSFDSLPKEMRYLTQIIPNFDLSEVYFPKYTATYFDNSVYWQQSDFINLFSDTVYKTDLNSYNEIYLNNGVITGTITYADTVSYEENVFQRNWFGENNFNEGYAGNIVVLLKNSSHEILDFCLTKGNGDFRFDNLEYGGYYVSVEKPGLLSDEIYIEISKDIIDVPQNNFNISQSGISLIKKADEITDKKIFPNPADNKCFVNSENYDEVMTIIDLQGKVISTYNLLHGLNTIDLSSFTSGIYFVEIKSSKTTFTQKLIVQ